MLLDFAREHCQNTHDQIIDIFWPILTLPAKLKFLDALPKDSGFHRFDGALMRHLPEVRGWDRARIRAYILDPSPSLLSRAVNLVWSVASYLPSFAPEDLKRKNGNDADESEKKRPRR
jgi:hypothetical protein